MNRVLLYMTIVISTTLLACFSTMKVRVDALNMPAFKATYLYNAENITKREKFLHYILSDEFQKEINESITRVKNYIDSSGEVPDDDANKFIAEIDTRSNPILTNLNTTANQLLVSSMALRRDTTSVAWQSYENNLNLFERALGRLNELRLYFNQILNPINPQEALNIIYPFTILVDKLTSTFGDTIVNDPFASIIAALPEQYWNKYNKNVNLSLNAGGINQASLGDIRKYVSDDPNRTNFTFAKTYFGNADIAIKMASPGEFIVKGVRNDADEAIRNSFKVVSQGIKYLAYSAGIPVSDKPNSPKKSIQPLLDSVAKQTADLQYLKERYSNATDAFLAVLISASDDLNATRPRGGQTVAQIKDAALARIKIAYEIYKKALSNQ